MTKHYQKLTVCGTTEATAGNKTEILKAKELQTFLTKKSH